MKLRQKLAVVLASAMVVTAVPVVTMASSSNKVVNSVKVIKKDQKTTGASLRIKFEDNTSMDEEEFYFTLTNADWLKGSDSDSAELIEGAGFTVESKDVWTKTIAGVAEITYTRQDDEVLKVNVTPLKDISGTNIHFELPIKATGGAVAVKVTGEGSSSTITEGTYTVISTGEDAASLSVDTDTESFYDQGELTKITLKETFLNSFGSEDMIIKIALDDEDFEFSESSNVKVKGTYGFNFKYASKTTDDGYTYDSSKVKFSVDEDDASTAYIWLSKDLASGANSQGRIEITGLKVRNDEEDITEGDLTADITSEDKIEAKYLTNSSSDYVGGADLDKDYTNTVLAKIANYGAYIKMKDEKAVDIVAGRDEEVTFEVIESIDDVFVGGRTVTLTLKDNEGDTDDCFFMISKAQKDDPVANLLNNSDSRKIVEKIEFTWEDETDFNGKDTSSVYYQKGMYRANAIKVTFKETDGDGDQLNANGDKDKFKIKTSIYVPVDQQDKKTIEIVGSLRGADDFKAATAVNVVDPFDVTVDETTLKVGLQNQAAGKITVTEKDKEMFQKGDLILNVAKGSKADSGIVIDEKGSITVSGDLKKADLDENNSKSDKITFKRQSKAASSVTLDGMEVTVDRTVPEGYYDLELSGDAIDEYDGTYKVEKYITIGTPNTQDITSGGLTKGTVTFVIGESKYTVNGVETSMDAPSYIQDPGYTMVPVRYVAEAFGVAEKDIIFGNGTVTIFAGERTISMTNGSNVAVVNGNTVAMGTAVVIKDGRTYVPAGEIARLIGITTSWDSATKTATFTN